MRWSPEGLYTLGETAFSVVLIVASLSGLLAFVHPRWFMRLAVQGSQWIDSARLLTWFDRRFDIDRYVLPYSRFLGVLVIASVVFLARCWLGY